MSFFWWYVSFSLCREKKIVSPASSSIVGNFLVDFLETLVILSTILLPTKSPVASAEFYIARLEAVFIASVVDFLAVSTNFFPCLLLILLAKDMNPYPFTYILFFGSNEYLNHTLFNYHG